MTRSTTDSPVPLPPPKERRRLREAKGLKEEQVAAAIGVTRTTIRSWETGRTSPQGRRRELYAKLLAAIDEELSAASPDPAPPPDVRPGQRSPARPRVLPPKPQPAPRRPPAPLPSLPPASTPGEAFDALYAHAAPALVRQTYLLTGRTELSRESVERAFHLAWQRWPEVAVDRDPVGWVRAVAYEYAMSPWHRMRRAHRHPDSPQETGNRPALLDALQELPPPYRRTLLLYDGLGLDLPETAAETEASTPAAANRLLHARDAVAGRLPELGDPELLQQQLRALAGAVPVPRMTPAGTVRATCERRAVVWTRVAVAATSLIVAATAITLITAPRHYERPVPPGQWVEGVPAPHPGPQLLSQKDRTLRDRLNAEPAKGPNRLIPQLR
ncbi:sigma factor-like helix-turn-helix DNA-binding protein [Streptomyces sp. NPDC002187]|uniref:sigma factor-like helix-turn-helix DNA-binding protein n=1 Tax=Streptomyces sp. NPDC002187 TaxID=3364637 RepID=UPI003696DA3B